MKNLYRLFQRTGQAVFAIDAHGRICYLNRACERMLGLRKSRTLGRRCAELLCARELDGNRLCGPDCPVKKHANRPEQLSDFDFLIESPGGQTVLMNASPFYVPAGMGRREASPNVFLTLRTVDCQRLIRRVAANCGASVLNAPAPPVSERPVLSRRETEVLRLAAQGLGNREIGTRLHISENTVKNHFKRIFSRLNVGNRAEAVGWAMRNGLL